MIIGPTNELAALDALPAPQAAAFAAALALGPPQRGDRLATCVATLGVLRAAAGRRPLLAIVDDLHCLDGPSRECLLYAAQRVGGRVRVALAELDAELPREGRAQTTRRRGGGVMRDGAQQRARRPSRPTVCWRATPTLSEIAPPCTGETP